MEDFDKIRTIGRCVRDGKMIVSEETDRILKLELELKEIKKKVENLIKTI